MKKRTLSILLVLAMSATMLAGCKSGSDDKKTDSSSSDSTGGVTEMNVKGDDVTKLDVWIFNEIHGNFYIDMAKKWNKENPDKKVSLKITTYSFDDMHNKLALALESGKGAPDVADIEVGKFPSFTNGTVGLMDLSDAIEPYKDKVVQSRLDLYSKDGAVYGFPTHVGATVAFYNTELMDEAGIDYTSIKTWDDFKAAGEKYHEKTGKQFAATETTEHFMVDMMLAQKGGDYIDDKGNIDLTNDKVVETLEYIKGMQDTGAFDVVPGGGAAKDEAFAAYNSGEYAAVIMPFWYTARYTNYMKDLKGKIAITKVPVFEEGDVASIGGGGTGTAVVKSSKNADLAAEVFAYIKLSEEANKEVWNVLGFDPVNTEVWSDKELTENPDNQFVQFFNTKPFDTLNEIKDNIGTLNSYTDEKYASINNELISVTLSNIYDNGMDVKEALKESQSTLENEFSGK